MTIKLANANLRVLESAILVLWQYRFYHFNMYYQRYYLFKLIYLCLVPMFSVIAWWTKITFFTLIVINSGGGNRMLDFKQKFNRKSVLGYKRDGSEDSS